MRRAGNGKQAKGVWEVFREQGAESREVAKVLIDVLVGTDKDITARQLLDQLLADEAQFTTKKGIRR